MRHKFSSTSVRLLLMGFLVAVLMSSGCSEDQTPSPVGAEQAPLAASGHSLNKPVASVADSRVARESTLALALWESWSVSRLIRASEGGSVSIDAFSINIPAGALAQDTEISLTCDSDTYLQGEFGPDGTQFKIPARVTISYANAKLNGIKLSNLSISWFDPASNKWVNLGGTIDTNTKTVSVPVWHFTQYALSSR